MGILDGHKIGLDRVCVFFGRCEFFFCKKFFFHAFSFVLRNLRRKDIFGFQYFGDRRNGDVYVLTFSQEF